VGIARRAANYKNGTIFQSGTRLASKLHYCGASRGMQVRTCVAARHFTNQRDDINRKRRAMALIELVYRLCTVIWGN
jgi:hypothetical protein